MPHTSPYLPDFEFLRQWRQEHYATWTNDQASTRRRALLTMVRDEAEFLPIWLDYYSRFFHSEDIYVLDHDTQDGSTSGTGFNRIPVTHPTYDTKWMAEQFHGFQSELFQRYDVVVTVDVDEIIVPDPDSATPDLGVYLDRIDEEFVNCIGYEILHRPDLEPPIDMDRPLLAQRGWWFRSPLYDKPAIATEPIERGLGNHRRADGENNFDPDLRMIHLHRLDFERCLARHQRRASFRQADNDVAAGRGVQNQSGDRDTIANWFHTSTGIDRVPLVPEPIEQRWKSVL